MMIGTTSFWAVSESLPMNMHEIIRICEAKELGVNGSNGWKANA